MYFSSLALSSKSQINKTRINIKNVDKARNFLSHVLKIRVGSLEGGQRGDEGGQGRGGPDKTNDATHSLFVME